MRGSSFVEVKREVASEQQVGQRGGCCWLERMARLKRVLSLFQESVSGHADEDRASVRASETVGTMMMVTSSNVRTTCRPFRGGGSTQYDGGGLFWERARPYISALLVTVPL